VITDHHFAPTEKARENLLAEGIPEERIIVTGNTVIDALLMTVRDDYIFDNPLLQQIFCNGQKIILVTTHRRESFGEPMQNALSAILKIVRKYDNVEVIFPVHYNPNVRNAVNKIINSCERIHLIEPLEYESFMHVMAKSYLVLTDSGGIQEEAPSLGKPVLVLRDTSERPEGIDAGTARLVGTNTQKILDTVCGLLDNDVAYGKMAKAVNPYGDGKASERILNGLCQIYLSEERVK
jgi:UDP-N-acetylglucosamine 2-epimerase (non-hydrolysing)